MALSRLYPSFFKPKVLPKMYLSACSRSTRCVDFCAAPNSKVARFLCHFANIRGNLRIKYFAKVRSNFARSLHLGVEMFTESCQNCRKRLTQKCCWVRMYFWLNCRSKPTFLCSVLVCEKCTAVVFLGIVSGGFARITVDAECFSKSGFTEHIARTGNHAQKW